MRRRGTAQHSFSGTTDWTGWRRVAKNQPCRPFNQELLLGKAWKAQHSRISYRTLPPHDSSFRLSRVPDLWQLRRKAAATPAVSTPGELINGRHHRPSPCVQRGTAQAAAEEAQLTGAIEGTHVPLHVYDDGSCSCRTARLEWLNRAIETYILFLHTRLRVQATHGFSAGYLLVTCNCLDILSLEPNHPGNQSGKRHQ